MMNSLPLATIKLSEHGTSLGPRGLGKQIREFAISQIRASKRLLFDFSGVRTISSAFADELFGLLFVEIGEKDFAATVRLNNFDNPESKKLILLIIQNGIDFRRGNSVRDSDH